MSTDAIVPDTKDWTWVLERRCPECGFDAARIAPSDLAVLTRSTVPRWPVVLARPGVRERSIPGSWSPLEYACHVRDVYRLFAQRIELILAEDDPQFANWDQDVTAAEERYGEQDPAVVRAELAAAAIELADGFRRVPDAALSRTGSRSDGAQFTVETLGLYLVHDPVHHLWDVRSG